MLIIMHMLGISSFLLVSWSCLDSQSILVQVGIVYLCCTDGFMVVLFEAYMIGLQHPYWRLPPVACGLYLCWVHGWNTGDECFLGHGVCLMFLFLCCYNRFPHLLNCSAAVSGVSFLENQILCFTCRRLVPSPTHKASVSKYSCCLHYCLWHALFSCHFVVFFLRLLYESACFLFSSLPCVRLPAIYFWHHVMLPTFRYQSTTDNFWLHNLFCMLSPIIISEYICTRVHLYTFVICTDAAIIGMCLCLLMVAILQYVIGWVYLTCGVHLCKYYVISDILMSLFVSCYIITSWNYAPANENVAYKSPNQTVLIKLTCPEKIIAL